jgi:hypothetical protein
VPSCAREWDGTDATEGWAVHNIRRFAFVEHDQIRIGEVGPVLRNRTRADDLLDERPPGPGIAERPDLLAELITERAVILWGHESVCVAISDVDPDVAVGELGRAKHFISGQCGLYHIGG